VSQDDLSGRQKPRSFSLSSESAPPLSPQSSQASSGSGSESHLDDLRLQFNSDACGMRGMFGSPGNALCLQNEGGNSLISSVELGKQVRNQA